LINDDVVEMPSRVEDLASMIGGNRQVSGVFSKPPAEFPRRGFARKHPHTTPQDGRKTKFQTQFLEEVCKLYKEKHEVQPRYMVVHRMMVQRYGALSVDKDGKPRVLHPTKIFDWLKARAAAEKEEEKENSKLALMKVGARQKKKEKKKGSPKHPPIEEEESDCSDDEEKRSPFQKYSSASVPQLKEMLKEQGLPVSGNKSTLMDRLLKAESATGSAKHARNGNGKEKQPQQQNPKKRAKR
jgi:hypothetical protein